MTAGATIVDIVVLLGAVLAFVGVCVAASWVFVQAVKLLDRL
jgi:hypothetical protein